jgi:hypothetical protein
MHAKNQLTLTLIKIMHTEVRTITGGHVNIAGIKRVVLQISKSFFGRSNRIHEYSPIEEAKV